MLFAAAISFPLFILTEIFPGAIIEIFNDDAALISYGIEYLRVFAFDYLLVPFVFCLNGLFIGAGHTRFSLFNAMISALLVRIPAAYIFGFVFNWGLRGIGVGAPFATFVAMTVATVYFLSNGWQKRIAL